MKKLSFITSLVIMLFGLEVSAKPFTFDSSKCSIQSESQIPLVIGDEKMESKMRVELVFKGSFIPMPRLQVTFLSHEPEKAFIEWKSIVATRKSVRQFRNEIFDRIVSEEAKPFAMKRISPQGQIAVFETEPLNLARSQDMVALFLSQNEISIHALTEQGDDWTGNYPLSASDSSYRELAAQCYGAQTGAYVKGKGQRVEIKNPQATGPRISANAIHWSEGYGLTEFTNLEAQIPNELRGKALYTADASEDTINKQLASWIQALKTKSQKATELAAVSSDPKYTALNLEISAHYQELLSVYDRFVVLTGNNTQGDGLIESKIKNNQQLSLKLAEVEVQIAQAQANLGPITQANTDAVNAVAPFVPTLTAIDAKTVSFNQRISEIKMLQEHLQTVLAQHVQELTANSLAAPAIDAPWSPEEIDKKHKEVADSVARIQILQALQAQVAGITGEVDQLVEMARVHQEASVAYLQSFAQQAAIKSEITKVQNWLYKSREVPNFTVANIDFFNGLNAAAEQEIAAQIAELQKTDAQATRAYKWEFDFHSALYNRIEASFVENATKLEGEKSLIAAILCHPDVLKDERNRKKPCLIIDDALNDKTVENFFANLPPEDVDALLGDVPRPWNQPQSKIEVLFERYQQEISNPSVLLQKLVDTWGNLRQVIWRWVAMQKKAKALEPCGDPALAATLMPNETYTAGFYDKVIECERAQVHANNAKLTELAAQSEAFNATIANTQAALQAADDAFSNSSRAFVTGTIEKLKEVALQTQAGQIFTKCLLPLEKAEECSAAVFEVANGELVSREKQSYLDLVKAMVGNTTGRLNLLTQENNNAVTEIQKLAEQKQAYIVENNIAELLTQRDALATQLQTATAELEAMIAVKNITTQTITTAKTEVMGLQSEATTLMNQVSALSTKIEGLLPAFTPFCQKILPNIASMQELDVAMFKLLGVSGEPQKIVDSSCDRPDLKTFIPNQKTLSLTGTTPR